LQDAVVLLDGERILAVGSRSEVEVPRDARVVDARGKWIIPGLIDAHVHFFQSGGIYTRPDIIDLREAVPYERELAGIRERLAGTFRRYLCSGVTSVVDVGGPFENFRVRALASNREAAPHVAVAGPLVSTYEPDNLPADDPDIIPVETPEEARSLVRREAAEMPDLVKVWFVLGPGASVAELEPIVRAAIEESHAHGVRAAVHATELETAKAAIRAGADILVHGVSDRPVDDEFIQMVKERGVIYTTTLVVFEGYDKVFAHQATLTDVDRTCGDPDTIATWADLAKMGYPPRRLSGESEELKIASANLKRMQDAGAIIAAGTDAGNIGTLHGSAIHREFELMAAAGLTPIEILVAATRNAARVFRSSPEMGTIEPGKLADLVILDADPTADIRNARKINKVIKGGRVFERASLVGGFER
jgi:imidazolonepropionase-like amidohydrolase